MHAIAKLIPQIQQDMVKQVDMQMKDKDPNFKLTLTNFPYGMVKQFEF